MSIGFFALLVLAIGGSLTLCVPVLQFGLGLCATAFVGILVALVRGEAPLLVLGWGALLFICAQVGYGIGVAILAVLRSRSDSSDRSHRSLNVAHLWK